MNRKIIAHAHIFKNAGSTIDWILERNFGKNFIDDRNDKRISSESDYIASLISTHTDLKAFSSHSLPLPITPLPGVDLSVLIMLRHPLLRVRSVYEFEKQQDAQTLGAKFATNASFKEYVAWRMRDDVPPTIRNMQVRYLTAKSLLPKRVLSKAHLEAAKSDIANYPLLGIVELFDKSMIIFSHHLANIGFELDFSYVKQNVTSERKLGDCETIENMRSELGEELYDSVVSKNQLDMQLYEFAKMIISERYAALGTSV